MSISLPTRSHTSRARGSSQWKIGDGSKEWEHGRDGGGSGRVADEGARGSQPPT